MEIIEIKKTKSRLEVAEAMLEQSTISMSCINGLVMEDVSATNVKIHDANLSDLEISDAQLGGAYIHNIGLPPEGHPAFKAGVKQRPLRFDNCDLNSSTISNCDLSNVQITDCNLSGMTINGISVQDLLNTYQG